MGAAVLAFVVPLKSRRLAKSWDHVARLCERTVKSICAQTSPAFKAIVVCHEKPEIEFRHPAVTYLSVDFPLPAHSDQTALNSDQCRKIAAGFAAAGEFRPTHVMAVDADDCISNRLAGWVERHPESPGWFFASGYFYRDGARRIYRKREDFYHWCGTSYIARYDLLPQPESGGIERVDSRAFRHFVLKEKLARQGAAPLPFPGAVYVQTKRGEATHTRGVIAWTLKHRSRRLLHHAEQSVLNLFRSEPLTPAIAAEFGLYPVSAEKQ